LRSHCFGTLWSSQKDILDSVKMSGGHHPPGSLSVAQLLVDAKRLAGRLREHDDSANRVVSNAQETLKAVAEMKNYKEDIESLNDIANQRPRPQLVLGIQQENRHIRALQQENKELRAALEEHQNAIELIMSKYRQHMMCLVNASKIDQNAIKQSKNRMLQDRVDKICEMATVMNRSIELDDRAQSQEQEIMSRLITENKGLREMLEISRRNGSHSDPLARPRQSTKECQTDLNATSFKTPDPSSAGGGGNSAISAGGLNASLPLTNGNTGQTVLNLPNGLTSHDDDVIKTAQKSSSPAKSPACCKHCSQNPSLRVAPGTSVATSGPTDGSSSANSGSDSRPVSVASSTSSEETIEEDDEVIFNTIKRKVVSSSSSSQQEASSAICSSGSELPPPSETGEKVNGDTMTTHSHTNGGS